MQGFEVGRVFAHYGIETHYYCCGAYLSRGRAACPRAMFSKEEFEGKVLDQMSLHVAEFVRSGGAALLGEAAEDAARKAEAGIRAARERMERDRERLDALLACLTPDLAPVLQPKIVELDLAVRSAQAEIDDGERLRTDRAQLEALAAELVSDASAIPDAMRAGTLSERKAIVRALVEGIAVDPLTGEAEARFRAVPVAPGALKTAEKQGKTAGLPVRAIAGARVSGVPEKIPPATVRISLEKRGRAGAAA